MVFFWGWANILMATIDLKRRTKIVATIGPATESPEIIADLIRAGASTFRLNFSHGDHEEHSQRIKTIRNVAKNLKVNIVKTLCCKGIFQ